MSDEPSTERMLWRCDICGLEFHSELNLRDHFAEVARQEAVKAAEAAQGWEPGMDV